MSSSVGSFPDNDDGINICGTKSLEKGIFRVGRPRILTAQRNRRSDESGFYGYSKASQTMMMKLAQLENIKTYWVNDWKPATVLK